MISLFRSAWPAAEAAVRGRCEEALLAISLGAQINPSAIRRDCGANRRPDDCRGTFP